MNIGEVVKGILQFLFDDATNTLVKPIFELIQHIALSPELLLQMKFIEKSFTLVQKIGAAILILNTMWQGFKAMFVGLGFEAEEPQKIAAKAFVAGFLIYYIKDILMIMVNMSNSFLGLILGDSEKIIEGSGLVETVLKLLSASGLIYVLLGIFLVFKIGGLMYKMFKRLAICALLLICSPLAVASMVSKTTEGFMQGFIKLFIGNIVIQIIQSLTIVICFQSIQIGFDDLVGGKDFFSIMLTIAVLSIAGQLEDILRDISISVGMNRDMQGAFGKIQSAAYSVSMLRGAGKAIAA